MKKNTKDTSEEQLKIFIDQCPFAMAMLDKSMVYLAASQRWISDFFNDEFNIIGRSHYDVFPEIPESWKDIHRRCLAGATEKSEEDSLSRTDGTTNHMRWEVKPWRDGYGMIGGLIIFSEDITERKRAEELLMKAKNEAEILARQKSRFLDTAAHELRTPITSLSLLLKVCEMQLERGIPIRSDILARLRTPTDRLVRLVVELLDMSKLERGVLSVIPEKTEVAQLITSCLDIFRAHSPKRSFIFHGPKHSIEINIDPGLITRVLTNLLDNAEKYAGEGDIEVTLEDKGDWIRVSVTDHGAGIPQEEQSALFSAFARGKFDSVIHASGLGLGLSVCKGIIDLHDGKIGATSQEGLGSTFYFELKKL